MTEPATPSGKRFSALKEGVDVMADGILDIEREMEGIVPRGLRAPAGEKDGLGPEKVEDIEAILADPDDDEDKEAEHRFTHPINPDPVSALAKYPPPESRGAEMEDERLMEDGP